MRSLTGTRQWIANNLCLCLVLVQFGGSGSLWAASSVTSVTPATWALEREDAGIRVYQHATASGYAMTRGMLTIPTSLDAPLAVLRDRNNCARWVFACKQGHLVTQYSVTERLDYTVIDSPLWFADRDMYIHSTVHYDAPTRTLLIRLSGRDDHDQGQAGRVRIRDFYGQWRLQPNAAGQVAVLYELHGNPQLPPSVFLDAYMVDSVFSTLNRLRAIAQEPAYRNARIPGLVQ